MSEMVERVALACEKYLHNRADLAAPINYDDLAREAMAAMREATETMRKTGGMVRGNHQPFGSPRDWNNDDDCAGIWRAMIDEALK